MKIEVIRVDGKREDHVIVPNAFGLFHHIYKLLGCDACDVVNLRDGRVMLEDDTGFLDGKPINVDATRLYQSVCRPGTRHLIFGDVAIAFDKDFSTGGLLCTHQ